MSTLSEQPTVALGPGTAQREARGDRPDVTATPTVAPTVSSPLEALDRDEILRTRRFCYVSFAISLTAGASLPLLHGDPGATRLLIGALVLSLLATAFMLNRTRDPIAFQRRSTMLGWLVPAAATTLAIPFFGAYSPAPVVLVLAIYFVGLGKNTRLAYAVYAASAGVQALLAALAVSGVMRDPGIITARSLDLRQQIVIQLLVQFVLAVTMFTARMSRRTQLVAIGELEREVRISAHREALLIEAREQLDRALRPGRGRFSEQTIGRYQLGMLLGRGAMGEVYEATDGSRAVAIKLLSHASLGNPNHVLRFLRELRTAAGITAPNVVQVLEVGEEPVPYLVMERLDGTTLAEILRVKRILPAAEVVAMIREVGAGITAAGAAGVVHRDLKPQNVFHHRGTWKILDFGVARGLDQGDTLTAGQIVGTPSYMAPEQAASGSVGHAADLYALAAIAYRALTGHPPFATGEIAETLYRVVHTAPRRPTELATSLPDDVDLVLAIALAKRPEHRFATADELVEALASALRGRVSNAVRARALGLVRAGAWAAAPRRPGDLLPG